MTAEAWERSLLQTMAAVTAATFIIWGIVTQLADWPLVPRVLWWMDCAVGAVLLCCDVVRFLGGRRAPEDES